MIFTVPPSCGPVKGNRIVQNEPVLPVCHAISFTHLTVVRRILQKQGPPKPGLGKIHALNVENR